MVSALSEQKKFFNAIDLSEGSINYDYLSSVN
jgi:hypothetical protein